MLCTIPKIFIHSCAPQSTSASCPSAVARVASVSCGGTSTSGGTPAASSSTEDAGATATGSRRDSSARTSATRRPARTSSATLTASTVCNSTATDVRSANALILVRCGTNVMDPHLWLQDTTARIRLSTHVC